MLRRHEPANSGTYLYLGIIAANALKKATYTLINADQVSVQALFGETELSGIVDINRNLITWLELSR